MVAINEKLMPGAGPQNLPVGNYYLLQDTLYRAAAMTDSSGNVVEAYDCDAYGNTLIFTAADSIGNLQVVQRYVYSPYGTITVLNADWSTPPTGTQPLVDNLYQGMTLDQITGLYGGRFRNYSPSLGRWTNQDPAGYTNGANRYQFVGSNPVNRADPRGLSGLADAVVGPGPVTVPGASILEAPFAWIGGVIRAVASWCYAGKMAQVNAGAQANYYQQIYNGHIPANVSAGTPEQRQNFANACHAAAAEAQSLVNGYCGTPGVPLKPEDYGEAVIKEGVKKALGEP